MDEMNKIGWTLVALALISLLFVSCLFFSASPTFAPGARVRLKASNQIGLVVRARCDWTVCAYWVRDYQNELRVFEEIELDPAPTPLVRLSDGK